MKLVIQKIQLKNFLTLIVLILWQVIAMAQDNSQSTTTTHESVKVAGNQTGGDWYAQPWVWIVGAAAFILLLIALLRGNNSSSHIDRVSVTKTVKTDSGSDAV